MLSRSILGGITTTVMGAGTSPTAVASGTHRERYGGTNCRRGKGNGSWDMCDWERCDVGDTAECGGSVYFVMDSRRSLSQLAQDGKRALGKRSHLKDLY
jgi:hypothetical protein